MWRVWKVIQSNKKLKKHNMTLKRIIIAGGGTGGHIFPAIAVAKALQQMIPGIEILFVGAKGKMEMEKENRKRFFTFKHNKDIILDIML